MPSTQIQLPDALYCQAKLLAEKREISLADQLLEPMHLGKTDPFDDPDWRVNLYMPTGMVAETRAK
ncbi:MAG: hypothetical protein ACOYOU_01470 [Kiritimatiellia bacterium]